MNEEIIKCKKCGAIVSVSEYFNEFFILCSKCHTSLYKSTSGNIIKDLIFISDEDVLLSSMLLTFIIDLNFIDKKQQKLLKLIRIAIKNDIPKKLHNLLYSSN